MSEETINDDITYEELVKHQMCLVCEHYGEEECDAGAGYSYRDEYGKCPVDMISGPDVMGEPRSFDSITLEEWESVKEGRL